MKRWSRRWALWSAAAILLLTVLLLAPASGSASANIPAGKVILEKVTILSSAPLTLEFQMLLPMRCGTVNPSYSAWVSEGAIQIDVGYSLIAQACPAGLEQDGLYLRRTDVRAFETISPESLEPGSYRLEVRSLNSEIAKTLSFAIPAPNATEKE